jgi:alkyldihydroxyacetonephosphate synthase
MRRWNGWGEETRADILPAKAAAFLAGKMGPPTPPRDATLADVLERVPPSRVPESPLFGTHPEARVRHARGQSLPDWVALRSGRIGPLPEAVARPSGGEEVRALFSLAREHGLLLVPWGGGTSVAGHLTPEGETPFVSVDLARLSGLGKLDTTSGLATFGGGTFGPDLERVLAGQGLTLGHYPQSFEYSTLGGWVATRSCGQESEGFGRIEDLFAGGTLEAPSGTLELPPFPASAAGPDLRHVVLGSEGRMGIVTEAVVRVRPVPPCVSTVAAMLPDWRSGLEAARDIAQAHVPLSMLRLSNAVETETMLLLAGEKAAVRALRAYLGMRGLREGRALLLLGASGTLAHVREARGEALELVRARGGVALGTPLGAHWRKHRFDAPYLRNALWDAGWGVDTLETAAAWEKVPALAGEVESAITGAFASCGERVHVFSHLSHVYASGSSLYTTFVFRLADPDATLERWGRAKRAASEAIGRCGGTISHQHGVGRDHAPYLAAEKGELGIAALRDLCRRFDPDGLMNPGALC